MKLKLGAVILNYNDSHTTEKLISALIDFKTIDRIVIVDNCSTDNSFQVLQSCRNNKIDIIQSDRNGGYGYGNNFGINYLNNRYHPQYMLILNPDVEIEEKTIIKMLDTFLLKEDIAIVAPFMKNRDGNKDPGAAWKIPSKYEYIFSAELLCGHFLRPSYYDRLVEINDKEFMEVDCVAGSLLMVDAEKMRQHGMYDENIFLFGEETTIGCKFKRAGLKTVLLLQDTFLHFHGVSINKSIGSEVKKRRLMLQSRKYILKTYLGASKLDLILAKIVYGFSMLEFRILLILRGNK